MRQRVSVKGFGALLLAAVLGGVVSQVLVGLIGGRQAQAADVPGEIRGTALVIVGEDGAERARLGAGGEGYGLVIRDAAGEARAVLALVSEDNDTDKSMAGGVALALHDGAGRRRVYLGPGPEGTGFQIIDPRGNVRLLFGEGPGGGGLRVGDAQGITRLSFGEGGAGGSLQVSDPRGNVRFSFGESADGGGIQLFDASGTKRFEASDAGDSGGVKFFDATGTKRLEIFDGEAWTGATLLDSTGTERAGIKMTPDGESDFYITGGLTEWRASACMQ
jgi:hypothetical protein